MKKIILAAALAVAAVGATAPLAMAADAAAAAKFTTDTPIQDLVANPGAKAVLDKVFPGLTTHPSYDTFKALSLKALAPYSQGKIDDAKLAEAQKALADVKG
ncbi:MAG: hypothetical protein AB1429_12025 [Pseudomonadota bacterium]|jgi:hypothetical protein